MILKVSSDPLWHGDQSLDVMIAITHPPSNRGTLLIGSWELEFIFLLSFAVFLTITSDIDL